MMQQFQPQIPQLTPQEANREMTPSETRQLQDTINRVRKVIARFHDTRRRNNERMAGLRAATVWPQQVHEIVHNTRQPQVEHQAVEQLRQFLRVLRGHEPNRQEMQEGIPDGIEDQLAMSGIPFAIGAVAIAMGTSVFSIFTYLNDHEDRIAQQTATPLERGLRALSDNIWGVATVGAVVGGVYIYHRSQSTGDREHRRDMEKLRELRKGGRPKKARPDKDDDEEKGSFFEKAKEFVRNGLFPDEKNAEESPAESLSEKFERLSENEQGRFISIINGEEIEEESEEIEEPEEIEENPEPKETEVEENPGEPDEETLEENEEEQDHEEESD